MRESRSGAHSYSGQLHEITFAADADELISPPRCGRAIDGLGVYARIPHFTERVGDGGESFHEPAVGANEGAYFII